jgi:hypothetical protein
MTLDESGKTTVIEAKFWRLSRVMLSKTKKILSVSAHGINYQINVLF